MSDGFLGRWARRKQAVQSGQPVVEPPPPTPSSASSAREVLDTLPGDPLRAAQQATPARPVPEAPPVANAPPPPPPPPPPSLDDAQALTPQSDFRPFMARDVAPEVKNVAMKKLFADPHFNVMDGLDIYIDDYTQPDPLPAAMLRQMVSAQFLNLVEPQPVAAVPPSPKASTEPITAAIPQASRDEAGAVPASGVSSSVHSSATEPAARPIPEDHDHTDLRLQQDHAVGAPGSGGRAE